MDIKEFGNRDTFQVRESDLFDLTEYFEVCENCESKIKTRYGKYNNDKLRNTNRVNTVWVFVDNCKECKI